MFNRIIKWFKVHWLGYLFKVKNTLPEGPKQEVNSSVGESVIITEAQALQEATKQEKQQWLQKKNDLRTVHFDLNPVWNNHNVQLSCQDDIENGIENSPIRAIKGPEEIYADEVDKSYSPWDDLERFPIKNHELTQEQLQGFKTTDNDIKTYEEG